VQGESREDLSPCDPIRGVFHLERCCSDSSLESWYADTFPRFIDRCRDLIVREAGPDNIEGLFLTGSFASGEGSVLMRDGHPLFLSDLDLVLVVSSRSAHTELLSRRIEVGKACEDLIPEAGFEGRIDIGVIMPGELSSMPRSPGVFDMRERGVLLCGEKGLLSRLPEFGPDEIGSEEALRLLENRIAVFLGERPDTCTVGGAGPFRFLYGISRVYTDIVTASLCAEGLYRPGYQARAAFLTGSKDASGARGRLGESIIGKASVWTGFKIDPSEEGFPDVRKEAGAAWLEAARDVLHVRDRIESKGRGRRMRLRDLVRSWNSAAHHLPLRDRLRLQLAAAISGRDPGADLRKESVRLMRHAVERGTSGAVRSAPGGFPHRGCSWEEAASRTSSEWRRIVMGRRDDRGE
jgi:hypothetical protein